MIRKVAPSIVIFFLTHQIGKPRDAKQWSLWQIFHPFLTCNYIYWNNKVMSAWRLCLPVPNAWTHFIQFLHYQLWSFTNVLHLRDIHLIISRAADKVANTSTLKIKSHNINSLCVRHNPEPFMHI